MIRTTVLQSLIVSESISLKNCSQSIRAPLPLWLSSQFGKGHTRDEGENRLSKHNVLRSLKKLTLPQDYWDTTRLLRHTWKLPIRCLKSSLSTKSCWLNSWVPRVLDDSTLVSGFHTDFLFTNVNFFSLFAKSYQSTPDLQTVLITFHPLPWKGHVHFVVLTINVYITAY